MFKVVYVLKYYRLLPLCLILGASIYLVKSYKCATGEVSGYEQDGTVPGRSSMGDVMQLHGSRSLN